MTIINPKIKKGIFIMIKLFITVVFFALIVPTDSSANTFNVKDQKRVIKIIGQVRGDILGKAQQLDYLSRVSKEPIYILINSPGGSVAAGMGFVDSMRAARARGVVLKCATQVMAASMAFIFMNECSERYATPNARLLFHPISLSTMGSRVQELIVGLNHTQAEEQKIMRKLQSSMGMDWKTFHRNYFAETFWQAEILAETTARAKWLRIVTSINGFGKDLFTYRRPGLFGKGRNTRKANPESNKAEEILERYEK